MALMNRFRGVRNRARGMRNPFRRAPLANIPGQPMSSNPVFFTNASRRSGSMPPMPPRSYSNAGSTRSSAFKNAFSMRSGSVRSIPSGTSSNASSLQSRVSALANIKSRRGTNLNSAHTAAMQQVLRTINAQIAREAKMLAAQEWGRKQKQRVATAGRSAWIGTVLAGRGMGRGVMQTGRDMRNAGVAAKQGVRNQVGFMGLQRDMRRQEKGQRVLMKLEQQRMQLKKRRNLQNMRMSPYELARMSPGMLRKMKAAQQKTASQIMNLNVKIQRAKSQIVSIMNNP